MNIIKNKVLKFSIICTLLFGFSLSNAASAGIFSRSFNHILGSGKKVVKQTHKNKKDIFVGAVVLGAILFLLKYKSNLPNNNLNGNNWNHVYPPNNPVYPVLPAPVYQRYCCLCNLALNRGLCPNCSVNCPFCQMNYQNCNCILNKKLIAAMNNGKIYDFIKCEDFGINGLIEAREDGKSSPVKILLDDSYRVYRITEERRLELIRLMFYNGFANIDACYYKAYNIVNFKLKKDEKTLMQYINSAERINNNIYVDNAIIEFLQDIDHRQRDFVAIVNNLQVDLQNQKLEISQDILQQRVQGIRDMMVDQEMPGYARQLVLPAIVQMHRARPELFTIEDMRQFYASIAFNHSFIRDAQFGPAVEFALNNNIIDIDNRLIVDAIIVYDRAQNYMGYIFENRPQLFKGNNGQEGFNEHVLDGLKDGFANGLESFKRKNNKKKYRSLANAAIVAKDLNEEITVKDEGYNAKKYNLPPEIVGIIMNFAEKDFGNKIYGNLPIEAK